MSQINLDDLTLRQLKQIQELAASHQATSNGIASQMVGKFVIVRSRNEGINAGTVKQADETGIILSDARRIWYHKPLDTSVSWYEGVAVTGLSHDSKVSVAVSEKAIIEDYSMTVCSDDAKVSIMGIKAHGQS